MKKTALFIAACLALPSAAVWAQQVREYQFPPTAKGSISPPSTLRITEGGAAQGASAGIVRDTPESLAEYQRCRTESDRAAISNEAREKGVMECLHALEMRRQQGAVAQ